MTVVLYILFSIISIFANLFFQWLSFLIYTGTYSLHIAIFTGTIAGLISKYMLDKRWVFCYNSISIKDGVWKFILYTLMGVFTTIIFWGAEISFHYFFTNPNAKYIGAGFGLFIGYTVKYLLDKKYVFSDRKRSVI